VKKGEIRARRGSALKTVGSNAVGERALVFLLGLKDLPVVERGRD
jgi:hypothetical protein